MSTVPVKIEPFCVLPPDTRVVGWHTYGKVEVDGEEVLLAPRSYIHCLIRSRLDLNKKEGKKLSLKLFQNFEKVLKRRLKEAKTPYFKRVYKEVMDDLKSSKP